MKGLVLGCAMIVVAGGSAYAGDGFGPPKAVNEAFNEMAKAAKVEPRMILRKCADDGSPTCMFSAGGKITVLAIADAKSPEKTQLIVFGADRSSDIKRFVTTAANAFATWSGSTDVQEIKTAFDILFKKPFSDEPRVLSLKKATYILKPIGGGGIFFTVRDPALD